MFRSLTWGFSYGSLVMRMTIERLNLMTNYGYTSILVTEDVNEPSVTIIQDQESEIMIFLAPADKLKYVRENTLLFNRTEFITDFLSVRIR